MGNTADLYWGDEKSNFCLIFINCPTSLQNTTKIQAKESSKAGCTLNFHPQAPVPPTRFLNQHAKDAAERRILLWRAIIFLVYSSIHCLGMFVLAVFGFRAFSNLSKLNEFNKKHKWNITLVLIFGSYKSRAHPTQRQLHSSHPTATLPKSSAA